MSLYWNGVNLVKTGLRFARYKRKQKQKNILEELQKLENQKASLEKLKPNITRMDDPVVVGLYNTQYSNICSRINELKNL